MNPSPPPTRPATVKLPGRARKPDLPPGVVAPIFVDSGPGRVAVTCRGVTGTGMNRADALRDLADRLANQTG